MIDKKREKKILFLWVLAIGTVIKSVFTEYGYDASYHVALSWRHINGDHLFKEMWEPHQTSSFIIDLFMKLYRVFVPSMNGVALYLQMVGAVLYLTVILCLYRALRQFIDGKISHIICILLLVARPKGMTLPEFSNLLVMASILLVVSLLYLFKTDYLVYCLFAAFATCVLVLAYPTCVLIFFPIWIILLKYRKKYGFVFLGVCFCAGILYLCVMMITNGVSPFLVNCVNIIRSDSSHAGKTFASVMHFELDVPYMVHLIYPVMMIMGVFGKRYLSEDEKRVWKTSLYISLFSFLGVILLSNLGILASLGYLVLGASVSLIPIGKLLGQKKKIFIGTVCMLILITRGLWVMNGYSAINGRFITNIENIVREGPAAGVIAPVQIVNFYKESISDWQSEVKEEDTVLAIGDWITDSCVYLFTGAKIANYSTIDTPTYSESLETYWNLYPYKIPNVIVFQSYNGEQKPSENDWIGKYIINNYELTKTGKQWSFYRRK